MCIFSLIAFPIIAETPQSLQQFNIPLATNLIITAQNKKEKNRVLIVYVWRKDCPFCKKLEKEVLKPMLISREYKNKMVFKKLELGSQNILTDIRGKNTTVKNFLSYHKASVTPTLLFLSHDGIEIAERIVGYQGQEFYWHYFDQSIQQANQHMAKFN